jgi:excisionase family DNA binding protein
MSNVAAEFPKLLRIEEVCEIAQCKRPFLVGEIAKGRLPVVRLSRKFIRIRQQDLESYFTNFVFVGPVNNLKKFMPLRAKEVAA